MMRITSVAQGPPHPVLAFEWSPMMTPHITNGVQDYKSLAIPQFQGSRPHDDDGTDHHFYSTGPHVSFEEGWAATAMMVPKMMLCYAELPIQLDVSWRR